MVGNEYNLIVTGGRNVDNATKSQEPRAKSQEQLTAKRYLLPLCMFVTMVLYNTPSAQAQPGCIIGDRIHRNTRITDAGNNCSHCTNNPPTVLLQLLHSSKPVLRLTNNNASGDCFNGPSGTLSVHHTGQALLSAREANKDFALIAASTANHLLLSTRNDTASIRFATTAPYDETSLGNTESGYVVGDDVERMRITPEGSIGIWQREPKEAVHVGKYTAIHLGHEVDMLGYNFVSLVGSDHRLLTGTSGSPGKAMKIGFSRHGYLEMGAGSTEDGLADDAIDWYEGGSVFGAFAGLTIQNINGNGCASFGKYYPLEDVRLYVKSMAGSTSNAFVAVSSTGDDLFRVRNDGKVGVGIAEPESKLHVLGDVTIGAERCTTTAGGFNARLSVDGIIFTKEIRVTQTGWADYVFKADYQLMPLADLRHYIAEHGHLPDVPNEEEVARDGVSVSAMQVTLLKKVEELTLYVLELARKNEDLRSEVEMLTRGGR